MNDEQQTSVAQGHHGWRTFGIIVITILMTLAVSYWLITSYLFPDAFTPVVLSQKEQQRLDQKLQRLGGTAGHVTSTKQKPLTPKAYSETDAWREIEISEKEFNALLASNTDLASRLAIDFSNNLASARLLVHVDSQFPVLGGKTIELNAGLQLGLRQGKPYAILKGVSIWGVPLPNAWLGNLKNTDLINEFGRAGGFWQAMHDGVEDIAVRDGKLFIKLKE